MRPREERIAVLDAQGYSNAGVARALGLTVRQVQRLRERNPAIAERTAELMESCDPDATAVLRALLADPDPRIRLQAAVALRRLPAEAPAGDEPTVIISDERDEVTTQDTEGPDPSEPPELLPSPDVILPD